MLKNIYLPLDLVDTLCQVSQLHAKAGDRVRRGQPLFHYKVAQKRIAFESSVDGWIRFIAIKVDDVIEGGSLLCVIDTIEIDDYRPDAQEINLHTELGEAGRRGMERAGEKAFGEFSGELFDAPEEQQGQRQRRTKEHPLLNQAKEGVPPKMSNARNNQPATDRLAEDASRDPELANQLSMQLQAQLDVTPGPSSSPTLSRG